MVWFKYVILKLFFVMWMAMKERLFTGERMSNWGGSVDIICVFC